MSGTVEAQFNAHRNTTKFCVINAHLLTDHRGCHRKNKNENYVSNFNVMKYEHRYSSTG